MKKILKPGAEICLYCGQHKEELWEEYSKYFECNCADAVKVRKIEDEIEKLKHQLPEHKFVITRQYVLDYTTEEKNRIDAQEKK